MTDTTKPDVSTPSAAYTAMQPYWQLADTLLGGTRAMRAAGQAYLPQHEQESDRNYQNRLGRATLLNRFEDSLDVLAGKPFKDHVALGDDVPPAIAERVVPDVDLQGTALQPFSQAWFRMAWAKGFAHVLVDQPVVQDKTDDDGNPRARTKADDEADGIRPYWVLIRPENVLAAFDAVVDGRRFLTHVRILETTVERDGFGEVEVRRIRVLEPGTWSLWRYSDSSKKWEVETQGATGLDYVPLVTYYAGKQAGLMLCKPPLEDLAFLNVAHWQSGADQRNVLTVARFPILAAKGLEDNAKVTIGPNNYLTTTDQGEWYYVEHTGAAIAAGASDLAALEDQMASYGSQFLRESTGDQTATGRALDSAEADSDLGQAAQRFEDCLALALQYTADYMGLEEGGTVSLSEIDMEPPSADVPVMTALQAARAARDISRETYLGELQRRGVLGEDFDLDRNQEQLDDEAPADVNSMFGGAKVPGRAGTQPPAKQPAGDPPSVDGGK